MPGANERVSEPEAVVFSVAALEADFQLQQPLPTFDGEAHSFRKNSQQHEKGSGQALQKSQEVDAV
jgi:hypothetical protein